MKKQELINRLHSDIKINISKSKFVYGKAKLCLENAAGEFVCFYKLNPYWLINREKFEALPREVYDDFCQAYNKTSDTTKNIGDRLITAWYPPVKAHKQLISLDEEKTMNTIYEQGINGFICNCLVKAVAKQFSYADEVNAFESVTFNEFIDTYKQSSGYASVRDKSFYRFVDSLKHVKDTSLLAFLDVDDVVQGIFWEYKDLQTSIDDKYNFFDDFLYDVHPIKAANIYNSCKALRSRINTLFNWYDIEPEDRDY